MRWLGYALSAAGIGLVLLPVLAGISSLLSGPALALPLTYAPTFVLAGILAFVVGVALRVYASG